MQQFLKPTSGTAWARIVSTQLLEEFFPAMHDVEAGLDVRFRREPFAALAAGLVEKSCCSRESLLPDGFARRITEGEPLS